MYHSIQFIPYDGVSGWASYDGGLGGTKGVHNSSDVAIEALFKFFNGAPTTPPIFQGINTFNDWNLVPVERPVFEPPEPKYQYVDIPAAHGKLDFTEALTKEPVYNNRTGSLDFYVLNHSDTASVWNTTFTRPKTSFPTDTAHNKTDFMHKTTDRWEERYSEIMNFLHGREMLAILEDDKAYFYRGRFDVNKWKSDKTRSKITLDYDLWPFKMDIFNSADDWLWDPFNFRTGVIRCTRNIRISENYTHGSNGRIVDIVGSPLVISPKFLIDLDDDSETFWVCIYDPDGYNPDKNGYVWASAEKSGVYRFPNIKLKDGENRLYLYGKGTVTIEYRGGYL